METMEKSERYEILIIDSGRRNIEELTLMLEPKHTVRTSEDGAAGMEAAVARVPDLILLNTSMPDTTGFQVLADLKSANQTHGVPVILIADNASAEDEGRGFALGAVDYIARPFHAIIVEARVRMHLQNVEHIRTIERLCKVDALTNIPNRRGFDDQIKMELDRVIRDKSCLAMLMIDVDNFKDYNDTYGHPQGDVALVMIAEVLAKSMRRPADYVARWGGEEFAALLPNTDLEGAMRVAEHMRASIEETSIADNKGNKTGVTVSIGVYADTPSPGSTVAAFLAGADSALYAAKNSGRNTVRCS